MRLKPAFIYQIRNHCNQFGFLLQMRNKFVPFSSMKIQTFFFFFFSSCCVSKHFHLKMYSGCLKMLVATGKGSGGAEDDEKCINLFNRGSTVCGMCIGSVMRNWVCRLQIVHWQSRLFKLQWFCLSAFRNIRMVSRPPNSDCGNFFLFLLFSFCVFIFGKCFRAFYWPGTELLIINWRIWCTFPILYTVIEKYFL